MKKYIIPVEWTLVKEIEVPAESLDEAKKLVSYSSVKTGTYLDDSFRINEDLLQELEENRKMKENIESNKEKLLDKTFSDDFLSTLPLRWVWVGKVDAVLPDGETCKAVKFSRSEGWGVKATTTEMLFVPQDEPKLSFEENYFDVYKTGFEGSDSLYKTVDFVSTSELEGYLKENLNNMAEFFEAISKK